MNIKPTTVWTWAVDWDSNGNYELCWFCYRTKKMLLDGGKPSPDAKPVKCKLSIARKK